MKEEVSKANHQKEEDLDLLLNQHAAEIDKLEEKLKDVIQNHPELDRIWLLRYVLSYKTAEEAEEPIRFALKWREDHADDIAQFRKGGEIPHENIIRQFQVAGEHKFTTRGEPIFYVRIGLCNTKGLMDALPFEEVLLFMTLYRFKTLDYCDQITRKERRLVKAISVLDFQGFSLTRGNDARFSRIIGDSSKLSEKLFPQLLGQSIFINVPKFVYWVINLTKPLMSKRAVEKMMFCPGNMVSSKPITACPFLSRYLVIENVPTFLGGKCNCPGGCIAGVPNSQTAPIDELDENGMACLTVHARTVVPIELAVTRGLRFKYSFRVEDRKVELLGILVDSEKQEQVVLPKRYITSEDGVVSDIWEAPADGVWRLALDNTHSMLRSKKVFYKIEPVS